MALIINHPFVSAKADSADASLIKPSNWNASHGYTGALEVANGGTGGTTNATAQDSLGLRLVLTGNTTIYVRTPPTVVTVSIASPAVVTWSSHGLQVNDPVVFSLPYDRGICTIDIANPAVVHKTGHGYAIGDPLRFLTSGALPTGITGGNDSGSSPGTTYYVIAAGFGADAFQISTSVGGAAVITTGTQSGTHLVGRASTLPTGMAEGFQYYVISAGFTSGQFEFSDSVGGAAINTSGTQAGKIWAQTGNDANIGSAPTRTGAFYSVQQAYQYICTQLDLSSYDLTIQLADGTYYPQGNFSGDNVLGIGTEPTHNAWLGNGSIILNGNSTNWDQVRLISDSDVLLFQSVTSGVLTIQNVNLHSNSSACMSALAGISTVFMAGGVTFSNNGSTDCLINVSKNNSCELGGAGTFNVTSGCFGLVANNGYFLVRVFATVTFYGNPVFSKAIITSYDGAFSISGSPTWDGLVTAPKAMVGTALGGSPGGVVQDYTDVGIGTPLPGTAPKLAGLGLYQLLDIGTVANTTTFAGGSDVQFDALRLQPTAFADLASLYTTPAAGMIAYVNNSTTATWGATIAGGGSNKVLGFFNGTNWTVFAA